jgi:hypothetical protein
MVFRGEKKQSGNHDVSLDESISYAVLFRVILFHVGDTRANTFGFAEVYELMPLSSP